MKIDVVQSNVSDGEIYSKNNCSIKKDVMEKKRVKFDEYDGKMKHEPWNGLNDDAKAAKRRFVPRSRNSILNPIRECRHFFLF